MGTSSFARSEASACQGFAKTVRRCRVNRRDCTESRPYLRLKPS